MRTLSDTILITQTTDSMTLSLNGPAYVMAGFTDGHADELRVVPVKEEKPSLVGNIYVGKVRKIQKNIDAAFIEIAGRQQCYYGMSESPSSVYTKKGNSPNMIEGDELIVQVKRDGLKTKLPAVSGHLEFPGNFLILTVGDGRLGISQKLAADDRKRLREWMEPLVSKDYGFIVRTNAVEASKEEIEAEAAMLSGQYETLMRQAPYRTCFSMLKGPLPPWIELARDTYKSNLNKIITDIPEIYESLKEYFSLHQPEIAEKVVLYQDDLLPLAKLYRVEKELSEALREQVWLKSGGYLVIQPTEALTVIDVNTGKYSEKKARKETLKKINLEAAKEAARQIRLRNLSGIILVDFINMENEDDKKELMSSLERLLLRDPVKTRLIDMTKLELVEITRRKVRKTLREQVREL